MDGLQLIPHPDFPSNAVRAITVDAGRKSGGELVLRFQVEGDLDAVIWPGFDGSEERADELWRHSCFEAFVGFGGEPGYYEFNYTTSMQWAAYRFDDYRVGMNETDVALTRGHADIASGFSEKHFVVRELADPREWHLGLSAVIEEKDGTKSYWALKHAPGKPDFHNRDCFIARLPAPEQP
jgi:hypothetical protein